MTITTNQLAVQLAAVMLHAIGDYLTQSDWMAVNKTKQHLPAAAHALVYSAPFLLLQPSWAAWLAIFVTHFFIDRYRLARYAVWAKNFIGPKCWWKLTSEGWSETSNRTAASWLTWMEIGKPQINNPEVEQITELMHVRNLPFSICAATGYPPNRPAWLTVWLLIVADNCCHILINGAALRWL